MEAPLVIFGLVLVLMIFGIIAGILAARKRREAFAGLAARLGLEFYPEKDHDLARQFAFLDKLRQGSNRYAFNLLAGQYAGHAVRVFDFHYETHSTDSKGNTQTHHHYFSFFMLLLPREFPEVTVVREGLFSKIAQAFGYDDIDFESAEFSRKFCVRSRDKRFAYDVCNPRLIEYLLANDDLTLELEGRVLALAFPSRLKPDQIEPNLGRLVALRERLPAYLFNAS